MDETLQSKLEHVEFPTLGHFIDEGFCNPSIKAIAPTMRVVGRARTVSVPDSDAAGVNVAIMRAQPGEVLVVDLGDDAIHACIGAVTIAAIQTVGLAGVLVNGLVTDLDDLERVGLPVFARGSTSMTTKRRGTGNSTFDVPVQVGGVTVNPGDWVLGDRNGVLVATDETLEAVIDAALENDAVEPDLLARMRAGTPLAELLYIGG
ncbi:RraA family protein [Cryobacterium psychrophilum]|uniref:Putative 4-hydroxy-4-methyl-2-oxoglutarate aldolase n=1 Tax=Cryobacterium psychrophilum TaxID=41988 RepID=A0A4Y8KJC7_9MICO|nr:RraA family protein [Cryobacterium psychrophilum]TDW30069.1 regulator of RNase E activity RraA [Cryobacterium psychrophilum]TFD76005.1 RraA family protein [Cryobacterium psychrophilum]